MNAGTRAHLLSAVTACALAVGSALLMAGAAWAESWAPGPSSARKHPEGVSAELPDGEVFVAGGPTSLAPIGELLASDASAFSGAGSMQQVRIFAAAAALPDGRVLIAGGDSIREQASAVPATAEVWNAAGGGTFTATGAMNVPRQALTLTTLPNGEVLAAGGSPDFESGAGSPTAELYDPATNAWTMTGSMAAGRLGHTATLLPDCRALIVGDNTGATTYNYVSGTFSTAGSEGGFQRSYHTATLLASGKVLIAGGEDVSGTPLDTASVWDPATGAFTPTANAMSTPHIQGFAARLSDGRVIVGGGYSSPKTPTDNVDIYDPATNSWSAGASLPSKSEALSAEAQTLNNGDVIVMGIGATGAASAIYTPSNLGPTVTTPAQNCSDLSNSDGSRGSGGGSGGSGSQGSGSGANAAPQQFAIRAAKASSSGTITLTLSLPAAGALTATASTPAPSKAHKHPPPLLYGSAHGTALRAGIITLTIRAGQRAAALLRRHKTLRVTVKVSFRPRTGAAVRKTVSLTVRRSRRAHQARSSSFVWNSSRLTIIAP